jgi:hypothetical protein
MEQSFWKAFATAWSWLGGQLVFVPASAVLGLLGCKQAGWT